MIILISRSPKTRAATLLILTLLILLLLLTNIAMSQADTSQADNSLTLSVQSMPLNIFVSALQEGKPISIEVDESIVDFTIDGQFSGSIESILGELFNRYGISHSEYGNGYKLWRDSDFASSASYQFQLSDMEMLDFLNHLSQATGYRLIADTSIKAKVNGVFNGTLRDTIDALSHQYPVLFYVSDDTISVVPESSFVKQIVSISNVDYSPDAFLTELRTKLPPGNFVNRQDDQLIIGGHPDFVRVTELKLQIDMDAVVSEATKLSASLYPLNAEPVQRTLTQMLDSILPESTITRAPLSFADNSDTAFSEKGVAATETQESDDEVAKFQTTHQTADSLSRPRQVDAATVAEEQDAIVSVNSTQQTAQSSDRTDEPAGTSVSSADTSDASDILIDDAKLPKQVEEPLNVSTQHTVDTDSLLPRVEVDDSPNQALEEAAATVNTVAEAELHEEQNSDMKIKDSDKIEQTSGTAANSKQNINVESVDQIPGFY